MLNFMLISYPEVLDLAMCGVLGRGFEISESAQYRPLWSKCTFLYRTFHRRSLKIASKETPGSRYRHNFNITAVSKVPGTSLSPGWMKWALFSQRTELKAQHEASRSTSFSPALETAKSLEQAKDYRTVSFGLQRTPNRSFGLQFLPRSRLRFFLFFGRILYFPAQIT